MKLKVIYFSLIILLVFLSECGKSNNEIVEFGKNYISENKSCIEKISKKLSTIDTNMCDMISIANISHIDTYNGKLEDSIINAIRNILNYYEEKDFGVINYYSKTGDMLIRNVGDFVCDKHLNWVQMLYFKGDESVLKQEYPNCKFYSDDNIPKEIEGNWFYKIEDNWYVGTKENTGIISTLLSKFD